MGYAKLFSSITESSLWSEPKEVRLLFVTMLAKANSVGFVEASKHGLARAANLQPSEVYRAIRILESPDMDSKNPDCEGRRIIPAPGGWIVLNYEDYRSRQSEEERREYMREYMRKYRSKQPVNKVSESKDFPSASASDCTSKRKPKDISELLRYASTIEISNSDASAFFDSMEAGGWTRGGKALKDWQAHLRSYKAQGWLASQRQFKNGQKPAKADYKRNYLPPPREPTEAEIATAREIARKEIEKLRQTLSSGTAYQEKE